ncbi:PilZ domain-containing protein [Gilvimarinus sp. SDUM040013]|uniref:PilZ domain-containing protein n=1 Tax=Gilvimarinus gilvus TaxID=3058038 RepID=A0ABU4RZD2_9GAMM|nr:PilZ domain-containing protein [Gilvimarinus sp. SDUM040013]MDO3386721.1 PilZ domain-containing protein [Gilvimarinus sp. SDUM040013]MDX6848349.1 PilZ domain-containing protein [Gilvimarinus sp. SDUM040013]
MDKPSEHEDRKLERLGVKQSIDVYDNIHDIYLGRVVNLHNDGLMIIGDKPCEEDCLYRLDLHLSNAVNGRNSVQLGVDCLWVRNAEDNSKHWAGFSIIDASPQALEDIALLSENQ